MSSTIQQKCNLAARASRVLGLCTLTLTAPALGQSAADKATARRLATEGIELYNEGKDADALARLQRAQALYDAPVHLLYIARAQAKLGQLVEASETYRRLVRVALAPNAPEMFRDAVDAGRRELPHVEERISTLRVNVSPPDLQGVKLKVDEADVSAAIIGIDRAINPGRHVVVVEAPGMLREEITIVLVEKEGKTLQIQLRQDSSPAPTAARGTSTDTAMAGARSEPRSQHGGLDTDSGDTKSKLDIFVGLRVGAVFPAGTLYRQNDVEVSASEYFKAGLGLELEAGAWFANYLGAKLYVEGYSFGSGDRLDRITEFRAGKVVNTPLSLGVGVSAMAGTPPKRLGGFGELGITFVHRLSVARELELKSDECGGSFDQSLAFTGAALRLGAGARIPVTALFQLTPFALMTVGQISKVTNDSPCAVLATSENWPASGDLEERVVHEMFVIGVGGDIVLGVH